MNICQRIFIVRTGIPVNRMKLSFDFLSGEVQSRLHKTNDMPDVPQWLTSFLSPPLPVGTSKSSISGASSSTQTQSCPPLTPPPHARTSIELQRRLGADCGGSYKPFLEPKCLVKAASCGYKLPLAWLRRCHQQILRSHLSSSIISCFL